jgi:hypothetical protein
VTRAFAPSLGVLVAEAARRPLDEAAPAELARLTLDMARRTAATHILFPFDVQVLARTVGDAAALPDAEPADMIAGDAIASLLQAAGFVAAVQPLAAHVPSPALLVEQLGAGAGDRDAAEAAEDLCTALARALLEAGARLLVVVATAAEDAAALAPLRRLAALFEADCVLAGPPGGEVARLALDELLDPERAVRVAQGSRVVLVDEALPAGADLAAVTRSGRLIAGGSPC